MPGKVEGKRLTTSFIEIIDSKEARVTRLVVGLLLAGAAVASHFMGWGSVTLFSLSLGSAVFLVPLLIQVIASRFLNPSQPKNDLPAAPKTDPKGPPISAPPPSQPPQRASQPEGAISKSPKAALQKQSAPSSALPLPSATAASAPKPPLQLSLALQNLLSVNGTPQNRRTAFVDTYLKLDLKRIKEETPEGFGSILHVLLSEPQGPWPDYFVEVVDQALKYVPDLTTRDKHGHTVLDKIKSIVDAPIRESLLKIKRIQEMEFRNCLTNSRDKRKEILAHLRNNPELINFPVDPVQGSVFHILFSRTGPQPWTSKDLESVMESLQSLTDSNIEDGRGNNLLHLLVYLPYVVDQEADPRTGVKKELPNKVFELFAYLITVNPLLLTKRNREGISPVDLILRNPQEKRQEILRILREDPQIANYPVSPQFGSVLHILIDKTFGADWPSHTLQVLTASFKVLKNKNVQDKDGRTLLHLVADNSFLTGGILRPENNSSVKTEGITPKALCMQTLLQGGADANVQDNSGFTPLHTLMYCIRGDWVRTNLKWNTFADFLKSFEILMRSKAQLNRPVRKAGSPFLLAMNLIFQTLVEGKMNAPRVTRVMFLLLKKLRMAGADLNQQFPANHRNPKLASKTLREALMPFGGIGSDFLDWADPTKPRAP